VKKAQGRGTSIALRAAIRPRIRETIAIRQSLPDRFVSGSSQAAQVREKSRVEADWDT
jgi:hypothetical protein